VGYSLGVVALVLFTVIVKRMDLIGMGLTALFNGCLPESRAASTELGCFSVLYDW
jgi:hypothetical protein